MGLFFSGSDDRGAEKSEGEERTRSGGSGRSAKELLFYKSMLEDTGLVHMDASVTGLKRRIGNSGSEILFVSR